MSDPTALLRNAYSLVAELWCHPEDANIHKGRAEEVARALGEVDAESASLLSRFLDSYPPSEEEYVELFELNPKCPLYLGSHIFEEPKTCAQAAVSDRNEYMIELIGVYRHFGLELEANELPDFLPLMVEALALTAGTEDPVREKFIREYFLPFLPPIREKLKSLDSPYLLLLGVLECLLELDGGNGQRR